LSVFILWWECVFSGDFWENGLLGVVFCGLGVVDWVVMADSGWTIFRGCGFCSFFEFIFQGSG
jgi:hypothetical protein